MATALAAGDADVVLLLEQINMPPGSWHVATDLANTFFSSPVHEARVSVLSAGKASNTPSRPRLLGRSSPALRRHLFQTLHWPMTLKVALWIRPSEQEVATTPDFTEP